MYPPVTSRISGTLRLLVISLYLLNHAGAQQFTQSFYSLTPSSCQLRDRVGIVSSTAPAFYEIEPGTAPFAILGDTGTIVATNTGQGTYTFIVRLMDQFLQRTSATAIVQVQCPTTSSRATFQQPSYQFGPVCQAGTAVGMVSLTNPPPGTRYFMVPPLTALLNLDQTTGMITSVQRLPAFSSSINVKVLAFFPGGTASVPVSILPCTTPKPTIANGAQLTMSSCSAGTLVGQVPVNSPSNSMRFASSGGANNFVIDPNTGRLILVNNLITAPGQRLSFVLSVEVTDLTTGMSSRGRVLVQGVCNGIVNNPAPVPPPSPSMPQPPPPVSDFR
ncbi:hypothetical protein RvY_07728 [Ramazzottius varieornatus]|uniref:Cadherin domain-containing protein n=1 Tax=Ramazzottius varieornatus TaxID=947166 RepID=A0A1D1VCN0_RAMVA|nr:hypothetical protein RvY_07728 [Ramazzottius varieornatus]